MGEYSLALLPSMACTWTTDLGFLLSSITSTWLDTICTFDEAAFGALGETGLAATTRTTLDNCFVDLATGLEGLISGLAVTSATGFVSITGVVTASLAGIAFAASKQKCNVNVGQIDWRLGAETIELSARNSGKNGKRFNFRFHYTGEQFNLCMVNVVCHHFAAVKLRAVAQWKMHSSFKWLIIR